MKAKHQDNVNELVDLIASTLKVEAQRLAYSGAIDENEYDEDQYALARILVTAAMNLHKDDFSPLGKGYKAEVKNLMNF